ncbi:hypothetical protein PoB_006135500 [Plakobranchus ocellatus]|uniref:Uncharacterized protein n=1 Tax=Plakobranchus ocellatus TaxID=259542 RepID=A0AAV4CSL6_9GAST|nr:hypothetical protein PoB_006135500 [Plakobranchus ocellatus]
MTHPAHSLFDLRQLGIHRDRMAKKNPCKSQTRGANSPNNFTTALFEDWTTTGQNSYKTGLLQDRAVTKLGCYRTGLFRTAT